MSLLSIVFTVFTITVILEFYTGRIFVLKNSYFPDRENQPDKFWDDLALHLIVTIIIASSLFIAN